MSINCPGAVSERYTCFWKNLNYFTLLKALKLLNSYTLKEVKNIYFNLCNIITVLILLLIWKDILFKTIINFNLC
jgi:hypothetical protein